MIARLFWKQRTESAWREAPMDWLSGVHALRRNGLPQDLWRYPGEAVYAHTIGRNDRRGPGRLTARVVGPAGFRQVGSDTPCVAGWNIPEPTRAGRGTVSRVGRRSRRT